MRAIESDRVEYKSYLGGFIKIVNETAESRESYVREHEEVSRSMGLDYDPLLSALTEQLLIFHAFSTPLPLGREVHVGGINIPVPILTHKIPGEVPQLTLLREKRAWAKFTVQRRLEAPEFPQKISVADWVDFMTESKLAAVNVVRVTPREELSKFMITKKIELADKAA